MVCQSFPYQKSCPEVLDEDDALELNDEEVDELLRIVQEALKGFLGNDEVLLWSHLRSNTISKHCLACNLGCSGYAKDHVQNLEGIADDV